jgi:hypothetical protein
MKKYVFVFLMLILGYNVFSEFYYVKASRLNVRMIPATDSKIVKVLIKGDKINIVDEDNDWGKIRENEWVYMPLLFTKIENTLSQIDSLKKQLFCDENLAEDKISNLVNNNSIFATKDQFESSAEYAKRLLQRQPIINDIRKQYCNDSWQKLFILRKRCFESENVEINLGEYNPDSQIYSVTVKHFDYQNEILKVNLNIERDKARFLYNNWDSVKKKVIHAIDFKDEIGLAQLILSELNNKFHFTYTFPQQLFSIKCSESCVANIMSASFSPDGTMIAYYANTRSQCDNLYVYNLHQRSYTHRFDDSLFNPEHICFSNDNKFIISFDKDYNRNNDDSIMNNYDKDYLYPISVFDLNSNEIVAKCRKKKNHLNNSSGQTLFTISEQLVENYDGSSKLVINSKSIDVFRINIPQNSDIVKIRKKKNMVVTEVRKIDKITKNNIPEISNYDIKQAVRGFCTPLICSNWSIGNPRDAEGETNFAVQVFCDCEHPDVPDYVLKAQFYVLISKTTLKPVKVIDVNE